MYIHIWSLSPNSFIKRCLDPLGPMIPSSRPEQAPMLLESSDEEEEEEETEEVQAVALLFEFVFSETCQQMLNVDTGINTEI